MEEIKVGEFVRTKKGDIYKFLKIDKNKRLLGEYFDDVIYVCSSSREINKEYRIKEYQISKHSFNIIDLIEEGDYVNGNKVVMQVNKEYKEPYLVVVVSSKMIKEPLFDYIINNRIKSIVTKEQFKAMEYEVK